MKKYICLAVLFLGNTCFQANAALPDSCSTFLTNGTAYGRIVAMVDEDGKQKTNFIIDSGTERACVSATNNEIRSDIMRNAFYLGKRVVVNTDSYGWLTGVNAMN